MIKLKHNKTGKAYEILSTFPNNRGEITVWIRSRGYHSIEKVELGKTIQQFIKDEYPMLEVTEDNTFQ